MHSVCMPIEVKGDDPAGVATAKQRVRQSIDRGVPVIAGSEEDGIIVGYEDDGQTLLWHSYYKGSRSEWGPMDKWPWGLGLLQVREDPPDINASHRRSLETAVTLWTTQKHGNYYSGRAAYEKWIRELRDEDFFRKLDKGAIRGRMQGNAHIYSCLVDARSCAAKYLQAAAQTANTASRKHLQEAAGLYDKMVKNHLASRPLQEIAPFPRRMKEGESWTQDQRNAQAEILSSALELEEQAIAELGKAVEEYDD